jgi:hypothetical protein
MPFLKTEKNPQPERRTTKRADIAIPLTIKLIGTSVPPPPITVETDNISPQGLSIIIKIKTTLHNGRLSIQEKGDNSTRMVKYLLLENKLLGLGINILPQGRSILAMGKVRWFDRSLSKESYSVRAGIFIEKIERKYKKEWLEFLTAVYQFVACLEPRKE